MRVVRTIGVLGSVIAATLVGAPRTAQAQIVSRTLWAPDGAVASSAYANGLLYVGGSFSHVAPATGSFASFDATSGNLVPPAPFVAGKVEAMAPDGSGGWFIGGRFSSVLGQPRENLAHLDSSGALTAWNPGAEGEVFALALDTFNPGILYVGGFLTALAGQPRSSLGAVDATTGAATSFGPTVINGAFQGTVYALAIRSSTLYAGGLFNAIGGLPRNHLAAIGTNGTVLGFDPDVNNTVRALAINALNTAPFTVTVYAGGDFTFVNGQAANHLAKIDGSTGVSIFYPASVDGVINALSLSIGNFGRVTVWAGGAFGSANGLPRQCLAAFDYTGAPTAWNPGADGAVNALLYHAVVYVGGSFLHAGGVPRSHLAAIDGAGAATAWDPAPNGPILTLGVLGTEVLAGGDYSHGGGIARRNLTALDVLSGVPTDWDPSPSGAVDVLAIDGGLLYAGGGFDSLSGQPRARLGRFDLTSGSIVDWNAQANGPIAAMAFDGGLVYLGGPFSTVDGQPRSELAALNAQGDVTAWHPETITGVVEALAAANGVLYVGGKFSQIGLNKRTDVAAIDAGGHVTSWTPAFSDSLGPFHIVDALVVNGATVYVGGHFTRMGLRPRNNLAAVDTTYGLATALDLYTDSVSTVTTLRLDRSALLVGGNFADFVGQARGPLAAFDLSSSSIAPWDPGLIGSVSTIAVGDGSVFAAGSFGSPPALPPPLHPDLVAVSGAVTGVGVPIADKANPDAAVRVSPNPARGDQILRFSVARASPMTLEVLDLDGRRVRNLPHAAMTAGGQTVRWDGRDDRGTRVPAGLYFVLVRSGATELRAKALRLD